MVKKKNHTTPPETLRYFKHEIAESKVDLQLGHRVDAESLIASGFDKVAPLLSYPAAIPSRGHLAAQLSSTETILPSSQLE